MGLRGKIITHSRTIADTGTPESIAPTPGTSLLSSDAVVQAKLSNTVPCFIGGVGDQSFELAPGAVIGISDLFHVGTELKYDLDEIFCKVGVNGEGVNILRTKAVSV